MIWLRMAFAAGIVGLFGAVTASAEPVVGLATPGQIGLLTGPTPVSREIGQFHSLLFTIITLITLFVMGLLGYVCWRFRAQNNPTPATFSHNTLIEVVWTVIPVIILVIIAVPSFRLMYFMDRAEDAEMTLKITGHQWYWEYNYPDHGNFQFQSRLIGRENGAADFEDKTIRATLLDGLAPETEFRRLLSTDTVVVLPVDTTVRILVTAADVLHSWAMPSFGIKTDAVLGQLNETWVRVEQEGVYYGQCSEICGVDHGFMPIELHVVSKEAFAEWVERAKEEYGTNELAGIDARLFGDETH